MPGSYLTGTLQATTSGNTFTTSAIDTTTAELIVISVSSYTLAAAPTLSDSKGNTWTEITAAPSWDSIRLQWYYAYSPVVGTGHTWTVTGSGALATIFVLAFAGTGAGVINGNSTGNSGVATVQPGTVTPSGDNRIFVSAAAHWKSTLSIGSGFTLQGQTAFSAGLHFGGGMAYKIQTTGSAENPTWTISGAGGAGSGSIANLAAFTTAAAATTEIQVPKLIGALIAGTDGVSIPKALGATLLGTSDELTIPKALGAALLGTSDHIQVTKTFAALLLETPSSSGGGDVITPHSGGVYPLILVRSFLNTGTEHSSDIAIKHPERFYSPEMIAIGSLDRGVEMPAGLPIIGSGSIQIADKPDRDGVQRWRSILHQITQRNRRIEIKIGVEGGSEETFPVVYIGQYRGATFPPDRVDIEFSDIWQRWLNRQIPPLGSRINFPGLPENVDQFFFPLVFGMTRIRLILCDEAQRLYPINRTTTSGVLDVYRYEGSPIAYQRVDPSEYSMVTETRVIDGFEYSELTYIQFNTPQLPDVDMVADIDGIGFRGEFGVMPPVVGTLRNIVDHTISLMYYLFALEPSALDFNTHSFAETWQKVEDLLLRFDGAIVENMTFGTALAQMMQSSNMHLYQNRVGQIAAALVLPPPDAPFEHPLFDDRLDILMKSGYSTSQSDVDITPMQPPEIINRFRYKYWKDFSSGEYNQTGIYDNVADQAELGEIEDGGGGDIELPFVGEPETALWVIQRRAEYFTLRSYHVELSLDAPRNATRVDLTDSFGVTYYGGIGGPWTNKQFTCYSISYLWDQLRMVIRGVARPELPEIGRVPNPDQGGALIQNNAAVYQLAGFRELDAALGIAAGPDASNDPTLWAYIKGDDTNWSTDDYDGYSITG